MPRAVEWIRAQGRRLLSENTSPVGLGVAVGVGVFFACTPFYGFQLWLALAVAWALRLNKIAVAAGTQFSIPPLIPFIVFASAWTGERVVHGRALVLSLDQLGSRVRGGELKALAAEFGLSWIVGGAIVGTIAGVLIGSAVAIVAARRGPTALPTESPAPPSPPANDPASQPHSASRSD